MITNFHIGSGNQEENYGNNSSGEGLSKQVPPGANVGQVSVQVEPFPVANETSKVPLLQEVFLRGLICHRLLLLFM